LLFRKKKENRIFPTDYFDVLLANLITEFFLLGEKPELPQKFPTNEVWSSLLSIETIFFFQMLHCSNGYCISTSTADDG
jgi:hypothetical protein